MHSGVVVMVSWFLVIYFCPSVTAHANLSGAITNLGEGHYWNSESLHNLKKRGHQR